MRIGDVARLIEAIGRRDEQEIQRQLQILITHERQQWHEANARQLEASGRRLATVQPLAELPASIKSLVWRPAQIRELNDLLLEPAVRSILDALVEERRYVDVLIEAAVPPRNKILFEGPPGNGKTSAAIALAQAMEFPLWVANAAQIVDSHLGETGRSLSKLFEEAGKQPVMLFLDEVDALGSERVGGDSAGKERNHTLTTLLTLLDRLPPTSLVVGATNRADMLDAALSRRFSVKLHFAPPTGSEAERFVAEYQRDRGIAFPVSRDAPWRSWAEVEEFCFDRHRALLLVQCGFRAAVKV